MATGSAVRRRAKYQIDDVTHAKLYTGNARKFMWGPPYFYQTGPNRVKIRRCAAQTLLLIQLWSNIQCKCKTFWIPRQRVHSNSNNWHVSDRFKVSQWRPSYKPTSVLRSTCSASNIFILIQHKQLTPPVSPALCCAEVSNTYTRFRSRTVSLMWSCLLQQCQRCSYTVVAGINLSLQISCFLLHLVLKFLFHAEQILQMNTNQPFS